MIEVTYKNILDSREGFQTIVDQLVPISTAEKIIELVQELEEKIQTFDQNLQLITQNHMDKQNREKELAKLLETKVKIDKDKLLIDELVDVKIKPSQFTGLRNFIETKNKPLFH